MSCTPCTDAQMIQLAQEILRYDVDIQHFLAMSDLPEYEYFDIPDDGTYLRYLYDGIAEKYVPIYPRAAERIREYETGNDCIAYYASLYENSEGIPRMHLSCVDRNGHDHAGTIGNISYREYSDWVAASM